MDEEEAEEGAPAWMATFADLMSLLLTFFVLLLSFANMDVMKFEGMIGSMKEAFGVKYDNPGTHVGLTDSIISLFDKEAVTKQRLANTPDEFEERMKKMVKRNKLASQVEIFSGRNGVVIRVEGDLLFASGSSAVNPKSFAFLDEMAELLRQFNHDVSIEGHTDTLSPSRRGGYASNFRLSCERALATLEYLVEAGDLDPNRLNAAGYGAAKPIANNATAKGRAKNRRVEFVYHKMR